MRLRFFVITAGLLSVGVAAHADSFQFSFGSSSSAFSGSGVLTTGALEAPGEYVIASLTGVAETSAYGSNLNVISLLAPGTFPTVSNGGTFPANDNTLFVVNGVGTLSQDGMSFSLQNGAQINLYNGGSVADALLERASGTVIFESVPVTIAAVAATPEPSTFALLGTGLLCAAGLLKRRSA